MTDTMENLELTVTRTISAPREKVFDAWLSPAMLARIMRPSAGGPLAKVTNDPVAGGRFSILMKTDEGKEIPHAGTYLDVSPHSRLSFTWQSEFSLDDSVVTLDFAARGPNATEVTLRQVKFRNEAAREGHRGGWNTILAALEKEMA